MKHCGYGLCGVEILFCHNSKTYQIMELVKESKTPKILVSFSFVRPLDKMNHLSLSTLPDNTIGKGK